MGRKQFKYKPIKCHQCGEKYNRQRFECPRCHPEPGRRRPDRYGADALAQRFGKADR